MSKSATPAATPAEKDGEKNAAIGTVSLKVKGLKTLSHALFLSMLEEVGKSARTQANSEIPSNFKNAYKEVAEFCETISKAQPN